MIFSRFRLLFIAASHLQRHVQGRQLQCYLALILDYCWQVVKSLLDSACSAFKAVDSAKIDHDRMVRIADHGTAAKVTIRRCARLYSNMADRVT